MVGQHDSIPHSIPSNELELAQSSPIELSSDPDLAGIAQTLQERGVEVAPGTEIIKSPFGMLYDTTRFYGVETSLVTGEVARYTIRAWKRVLSDKHLAARDEFERRAGLGSESREEFLREMGVTGILVVATWSGEVDGKPREVENVLNYQRQDVSGIERVIRARNGVIDPTMPESLISPFVTPVKLSGRPLTIEDAELGDSFYRDFSMSLNRTFTRDVLYRLGNGFRRRAS